MRYTLDTSALIAYLAEEDGASEVQEILGRAVRGEDEVWASFMTHMELTYEVWRRLGEDEAKEHYLRLKALPIRRLDVTEPTLLAAARIKAGFHLSVADSWIAAAALLTGSRLVHRDPEFRPLDGILDLLELPARPGRRRP